MQFYGTPISGAVEIWLPYPTVVQDQNPRTAGKVVNCVFVGPDLRSGRSEPRDFNPLFLHFVWNSS
jgi:hypothetical protein